MDELVDEARRKALRGLIFKLDFEKAYDMDKVLIEKGFGRQWCAWISGCFSNAYFVVLVNRTPRYWFSSPNGLRQGDPMSLFLFTLVVDIISRVLDRGVQAFFGASRLEGVRVKFSIINLRMTQFFFLLLMFRSSRMY